MWNQKIKRQKEHEIPSKKNEYLVIWVCVDAEIDFYEKERLGVELWAVEEL